jgi:hypothetical protein
MKPATLVLAVVLLFGNVRQVRAGLIITFSQEGANVVATGSGSLNTTSLVFAGYPGYQNSGVVFPDLGTLNIGYGYTEAYTSGITGPAAFGSSPGPLGEYAYSFSLTGDAVGIEQVGSPSQSYLIVPEGYQSGASLASSATWDDVTISELGLTPGTYIWTWGSGATADSLEIIVPGTSAVPEPSCLTLLGMAFVTGLGYGCWRRRKGAMA